MITYKITTVFVADMNNLLPLAFPGSVIMGSRIEGNVATFTFADDSVKAADLGPLVRVEVIPNP